MEIDKIMKQLQRKKNVLRTKEGNFELRNLYETILEKYEQTPLTLPIEDVSIRRVCQVLTNNNYITHSSCEGHGKTLPQVFFTCKNQDHLRDLVYLVTNELSLLSHFQWQISTYSPDPYLNSEKELSYVLEPASWDGKINPQKNQSSLIEDLDFIGISTLRYFNTPWRFTDTDEKIAKAFSLLNEEN